MVAAATKDSGGGAGEDKNQPESLLEVVAATCCKMDDVQPSFSDVENQNSHVVKEGVSNEATLDDNNPDTSTILKGNPFKVLASTNTVPSEAQSTIAVSNIGIFATNEGEDDTASVFSFDSYEKQPRIPLRVQNILQRDRQQQQSSTNDLINNSTAVPFPSVIGASLGYDNSLPVVNVCPCRCLFFTLKETICLIMSALGCAVFLAGLVLLCMYLEGSIFS